jgi:hypothetical protein
LTDKEADPILKRFSVVKNILDYENEIKAAQELRLTGTGYSTMSSRYSLITGEIAELLSGQTNKDIFTKKMSAYRSAVYLDERNFISSKTDSLKALNSYRQDILSLERKNENNTYTLPDPATNLSGFRSQLETELKQTLSDENVLGQYGQYLFYQAEDLAQYAALLSDARYIDREIDLP